MYNTLFSYNSTGYNCFIYADIYNNLLSKYFKGIFFVLGKSLLTCCSKSCEESHPIIAGACLKFEFQRTWFIRIPFLEKTPTDGPENNAKSL